MKTAVVALLLVAAVSARIAPRDICNSDSDHDFTDGCVGTADPANAPVLLTSETITARAKFFQVVTKIWSFPHTGTIKGPITCVKVRDLMPDSTGGCPFLKLGGVGSNEVTLEVVSQRSKAMKLRVEVYGVR